MFIISSNVRGLPNNCNGLHLRPDIMYLFEKSDIVYVQETWYAYQDLYILHNLHSECRYTGVSTTDYNDELIQSHHPGGVAIYRRKRLDNVVKSIDTNCNWCTAMDISTGSNATVLIYVYYDPLIAHRAALRKSTLDVTSACTSVLCTLTGRRIFFM